MRGYPLLQWIGLFFLGLGVASGIALFIKAVAGKSGNNGTLWGLFILGVAVGIFIIFCRWPIPYLRCLQ